MQAAPSPALAAHSTFCASRRTRSRQKWCDMSGGGGLQACVLARLTIVDDYLAWLIRARHQPRTGSVTTCDVCSPIINPAPAVVAVQNPLADVNSLPGSLVANPTHIVVQTSVCDLSVFASLIINQLPDYQPFSWHTCRPLLRDPTTLRMTQLRMRQR